MYCMHTYVQYVESHPRPCANLLLALSFLPVIPMRFQVFGDVQCVVFCSFDCTNFSEFVIYLLAYVYCSVCESVLLRAAGFL